MNRPRVAAVISAIGGSTAGFLVIHRWGLIGTFTGAAIVPVVYTLVSHASSAGFDSMDKWLRDRRRGAGQVDSLEGTDAAGQNVQPTLAPAEGAPTPVQETAQTPVQKEAQTSAKREDLPAQDSKRPGATPRKRGRVGAQWSLAALGVLALTLSIYSLVQAGPGERTIVRERVIEKTVTETVTVTTVQYVYASAPTNQSQNESDTATSDQTATTEQTATTDQTSQDPDSSSTTTVQGGTGEDPSSTTSSDSTTTTLP